jgi:hypothetical protein
LVIHFPYFSFCDVNSFARVSFLIGIVASIEFHTYVN